MSPHWGRNQAAGILQRVYVETIKGGQVPDPLGKRGKSTKGKNLKMGKKLSPINRVREKTLRSLLLKSVSLQLKKNFCWKGKKSGGSRVWSSASSAGPTERVLVRRKYGLGRSWKEKDTEFQEKR